MAIALRGTPKGGSKTDGTSVVLTFDTGADAPQTDDVVVVWGGHPHEAGSNLGPNVSWGYTEIAKYNSAAPNFGAWYKVMGATPDTQVGCYGDLNGTHATAYGCAVWSGVDPSIFDQTQAVAGPTTGTNPDPPAIVTQTANAVVIAMAGSTVNDTSPGSQTNYTQLSGGSGNASGVDFSTRGSYRVIATPTTENPPAWSSWASGANYRITIALKPASTPAIGTFSQTLGAATLSATATLAVTAALALTLGSLTPSADADVGVKGTATQTLGALTLSGTATVTAPGPVGTLSLTLGTLTAAGTAQVPVLGSSTPTLGALTASGDADVAVAGLGTVTLGDLTCAATGIHPPAIGTLDVTLGGGVAQGPLIYRGKFSKYYTGNL